MVHWRRLATISVIFACSFSAFGQGTTSAALPTAKDIVARYDEALGGRDAIKRHTSSTMRGTTDLHEQSGVLTLPFIFFAGAPYRRLEKTTLPQGIGDVMNGFDGETAWSFHPKFGAQVYSGNDRESMKRDADFYYTLNELSWFKSMETVGIEDFEGRPCYRLHGINNWDKSNDHFYDKETGLLAGYEFDSELGRSHEIFTDYKKVDGVLIPMKQIVKVRSKEGAWTVVQVLNFESVTFNDVDPAVFAPPQSVRDLSTKARRDAPH